MSSNLVRVGREAIRYLGNKKPMKNPTPAIECIKKNPPILVKDRIAHCDGGHPHLGHPRVYMNLDEGQYTCGYCGQVYKQDTSHNH